MKHNFKDLITDPLEQEAIDSILRAKKEVSVGNILNGDIDELAKQVSDSFD